MAMDSSTAQSHLREVGPQTLESMLTSTKPQQEKKPRPAEQSLKCPRCDSTNTKFCYYNNYSLSQPRYFCKSCRRYWTKGGTLRNVPVGGGCRKTKRSSSSSSSSSSRRNHDNPITTPAIPSYTYDTNITIPGFQKPTPGRLGMDDPSFPMSGNACMSVGDGGLIDALRGGSFLEVPRGFQNVYGDGSILGLECGGGMGMGIGMTMGMGIGVLNQEMGLMGFEEYGGGGGGGAAAAVKQEMCSSDGKWGFPWQNVGGDGSMGDLDSTRIGSWNGIGSATWHGLLNSPLM